MPDVVYDPGRSMREARKLYFERNGFGSDGGYDDAWVDFKLGPLSLRIPNTASRVRAVVFHDLHHVITAYDTDYIGEFEISAWEVGAGCRDFWAAWFINLGGVVGGLFCAPRRTLRAFVRGRRSRTLYGQELEELLDQSVAQVRARSGAAQPVRLSTVDLALFALSAAAGMGAGIAMLVGGSIAAAATLVVRSG